MYLSSFCVPFSVGNNLAGLLESGQFEGPVVW
jgi:hypothetical protein